MSRSSSRTAKHSSTSSFPLPTCPHPVRSYLDHSTIVQPRPFIASKVPKSPRFSNDSQTLECVAEESVWWVADAPDFEWHSLAFFKLALECEESWKAENCFLFFPKAIFVPVAFLSICQGDESRKHRQRGRGIDFIASPPIGWRATNCWKLVGWSGLNKDFSQFYRL